MTTHSRQSDAAHLRPDCRAMPLGSTAEPGGAVSQGDRSTTPKTHRQEQQ